MSEKMKITFRTLYRSYKKESINNNSLHDILKNKKWKKTSINPLNIKSYGKTKIKTDN